MNYPSHWRAAYLAAFFIHLAVWLFFSLVAPNLFKDKVEDVQILEWVDESLLQDGEAIPLPEAKPEPPPPPPVPRMEQPVEPEEVMESTPIVTDDIEEAIEELKKEEQKPPDPKEKKKVIVVAKKGIGTQMGQPPKLIQDFDSNYQSPAFKGRVTVQALIGTDGKIKDTKIMITSGNGAVDSIARSTAKKWLFKPALDSHGKPMECYTIIPVYFR